MWKSTPTRRRQTGCNFSSWLPLSKGTRPTHSNPKHIVNSWRKDIRHNLWDEHCNEIATAEPFTAAWYVRSITVFYERINHVSVSWQFFYGFNEFIHMSVHFFVRNRHNSHGFSSFCLFWREKMRHMLIIFLTLRWIIAFVCSFFR